MTPEKNIKFDYWYVNFMDDSRIYFRTEEGAKRYFLAEDAYKPNGVVFYSGWGLWDKDRIEYTYEQVKAMDLETIRKLHICRKIIDYENCYPVDVDPPIHAVYEMNFED